jgi:hypothetical protein
MLLAALGALYAAVASIGEVTSAGPSTQQVYAWRMVSFTMFAAVFALLAIWPRRYPYLWEVTIINKIALTLVELVLISRASQAVANGIIDAILSVLLIAAYLLSRGYQATRATA